MTSLAYLVSLVGLEPVFGVAVLVGEHRDRLATQLVGSAKRPDRDLPAVGDQHLAEHVPAPFPSTAVGQERLPGPLWASSQVMTLAGDADARRAPKLSHAAVRTGIK